MNNKAILVLICSASVFSFVFADDTTVQKVSKWKGSSANIGLILNRGNTVDTSVNTGVSLVYTTINWKNTFQGTYAYTKNQTDTTKNQGSVQNQTNYNFNKAKTRFIFANEGVTLDQMSPYHYQLTFAGGYGQVLYQDGDKISWTAQFGPGYNQDKTRSDHKVESTMILQTQTNFSWAFTKTATFTQSLQVNWGRFYNYFQSQTALQDQITSHIGLQISLEMKYYSRIPSNSTDNQNLDTTTNLTMIYNF